MRCYSIYKTAMCFYGVYCGHDMVAKFNSYKEAENYIRAIGGRQFCGIKH